MSVLKIKNENNEWVSIPAIKGEDGIGILRTEINNDGELIITYSDKSTTNLGKIAGIDGVSIINSEINSDGELILTYSNNTIKNLGVVIGSNGEDGLGISKVEINEDGELEITYTNGNLINLGSVVGEGSQNVIIDQTYNPESENAQSGMALNPIFKKKLEIWQPNVEYKINDIVITNFSDDEIDYTTVAMICLEDHTSPNLNHANEDNNLDKHWAYIPMRATRAGVSRYAIADGVGNNIETTYATKEYVNNLDYSFSSISDKINTLSSTSLKRQIIEVLPNDINSANSNTIYMVGPNNEDVYEEYMVVESIIPHSEMYIPVTSFLINNLDYTGNSMGINYGRTTYKKYDMNSDDEGNISVVINLYSETEDSDIKFTIVDVDAQNSFMSLVVGEDAKKYLFSFTYTGESLIISVEYIDSNWELIGSSKCDLTNYVTKEEILDKMDKFGEVETEIYDNEEHITLHSANYLTIESDKILSLKGDAVFLSSGASMCGTLLKHVGYPTSPDDATNKAYVDTQIGNISSALDELHTYAQSLIGGATE